MTKYELISLIISFLALFKDDQPIHKHLVRLKWLLVGLMFKFPFPEWLKNKISIKSIKSDSTIPNYINKHINKTIEKEINK